jgi:hypothetical protein
MAESPANGLRYERKFVTFELDLAETLAVIRLHPAAFREAYHPRFVNNVYFDTPSFDHYHANVRGIADRVKCRIRWYGAPLGPIQRPTLELKRRHGLVGSKESHPLRPFDLDAGLDAGGLFEKSEVPAPLRCDLAPLRPVLLNRYRRRYFVSRDESYRLTLDTDLGFRTPTPGPGRSPTWVGRDGRVIVELKFGIGKEDEGARIATRFPFRLTRSSKYVVGVDTLYG